MDDNLFETTLESIKADRERGASELARECLAVMAESTRNMPANDEAELYGLLHRRAERLMHARPSMTPIYNLLLRWQTLINEKNDQRLATARVQAARLADELIEYSLRAVGETARQVAEHLGPDSTLMTHSLSSTVLAVFRGLQGQGVKAIITESRPLYEGRLLAKRLSDWHIPTTLITDAQIGLFVPQADAVLVGADSLLPDGSMINKVGSYPLALVARDQGVPFYVCCESFKRRSETMGVPELEAMDTTELDATPLPDVELQNIYFDTTPAHLISAWFDEKGMHANPQYIR